jgi:mannose-6-phosphate isomerase-like protein (cupin superfamily)
MKSNHKFVSKRWGYEIWIENNKNYCCKHLHVVPEKWCSFHYHKNKKETFYVTRGELLLVHARYSDHIENMVKSSHDPRWDWIHNFPEKSDMYYQFKTQVLKAGDSLTIEPYVLHTFTTNTSKPCDFVEASTFHEDADSYRVYEG